VSKQPNLTMLDRRFDKSVAVGWIVIGALFLVWVRSHLTRDVIALSRISNVLQLESFDGIISINNSQEVRAYMELLYEDLRGRSLEEIALVRKGRTPSLINWELPYWCAVVAVAPLVVLPMAWRMGNRRGLTSRPNSNTWIAIWIALLLSVLGTMAVGSLWLIGHARPTEMQMRVDGELYGVAVTRYQLVLDNDPSWEEVMARWRAEHPGQRLSESSEPFALPNPVRWVLPYWGLALASSMPSVAIGVFVFAKRRTVMHGFPVGSVSGLNLGGGPCGKKEVH
jgi:hypothetical protein